MTRSGGLFMKLLLGIGIMFGIMWVVSAFVPRSFSQETLTYFDRAFLDKSTRRANLSYVSNGLQSIVTLLALFMFANRGHKSSTLLGIQLSRQASPSGAFWVGVALALQTAVLLTLVSLPFRMYNGYYLEKTFGLSRLTISGWLVELLKSSLLNFFIYAIAGGLAAFLLARFPGTWPYLLTVLLFFGSIFFAYLYPSVIAPMFDEFAPLEDPVLLQDVQELAANAGMKVDKVLVMEASAKTARANAYFTGLGRAKQVVLYDTLLANHSVEEVRLVLAHELGHWKYGHIMRGISVSAAGTLIVAMLFSLVSGPVPGRLSIEMLREVFLSLVLFAVLTSYVATPVASFLSRRNEIQADVFSLNVTGDPDSFIAAMIGLAKANLGDVQPPRFIRWFAWTHPATVERITLGEQWKSGP
ncbi:MAG TPA: M48 family metallopeptidase [Firmicutes bacterium]|nr:M48 family metallopeptidase [Candidatus Fermentithermobacillaceae bacterium]